MKLYYAPGACSLATRICLHQAGITAEFERVDLHARVTETGTDYLKINPKGSVPLLVLEDGQTVSENVALLDLLAERAPSLGVRGPLGRTRLIEMLSFLSTELHIAFKPFFHDVGAAEKAMASEVAARDLDLLTARVDGRYLFGPEFTVADAYLFAMLRWAVAFDVPMMSEMFGYFGQVASRAAVRRSLAEEGLPDPRAFRREKGLTGATADTEAEISRV
jgi:glutathione S-transferase